MVLTNEYYIIDAKTDTELALKIINYIKKHQGTNIRDILNKFGTDQSNWEIKETVMQLISSGNIELSSDATLKFQEK
jgi:uncharacterized protein YpbB